MSLGSGKDITDQINIDRSASRVNVVLRGAKSKQIRQLKTQAEDWLDKNAPAHMATKGTSINVLFAYLSTVNIERMLAGTLLSFLAISLIIGLALKSTSYGLISLVTNILPAFAGFGIWGLMFGEINLAAAVITAMTLGIVVDDTIHFLVNCQKLRQGGFEPAQAVMQATESVGTAMIITTISLATGFFILALSDFQVNQTLGTFTALILVIALLADLFILPAALIKFDAKLHITPKNN